MTLQTESVKFVGTGSNMMGKMKKDKTKRVDDVELVLGEKLPKNGSCKV
jgi:hypothetical protein